MTEEVWPPSRILEHWGLEKRSPLLYLIHGRGPRGVGHFNVFIGPKAELDFQEEIARALDLRIPNRGVVPRGGLRDRPQPTGSQDGVECKGEGHTPTATETGRSGGDAVGGLSGKAPPPDEAATPARVTSVGGTAVGSPLSGAAPSMQGGGT